MGERVLDLAWVSGPHASPARALAEPDPRLEVLTRHRAAGRHRDLALVADDLLREGVRDLRLLGYWFYGLFLGSDLEGLAELLQAARRIQADLAAWQPEDQRKEHYERAIRWFADHAQRAVDARDGRPDELWDRWASDPASADRISAAIDAARQLRGALDPEAPAVGALARLEGRLESLGIALAFEPEPALPEQASTPDDEPSEPHPSESAPEEPVAEAPEWAGGDVSPAFRSLLDKLLIFEALIDRGDHRRAAVVASDLDQIIANFDPRVYFPHVFRQYYISLAQHADELAQHRDTPEARALAGLYRVDPDGFARG